MTIFEIVPTHEAPVGLSRVKGAMLLRTASSLVRLDAGRLVERLVVTIADAPGDPPIRVDGIVDVFGRFPDGLVLQANAGWTMTAPAPFYSPVANVVVARRDPASSQWIVIPGVNGVRGWLDGSVAAVDWCSAAWLDDPSRPLPPVPEGTSGHENPLSSHRLQLTGAGAFWFATIGSPGWWRYTRADALPERVDLPVEPSPPDACLFASEPPDQLVVGICADGHLIFERSASGWRRLPDLPDGAAARSLRVTASGKLFAVAQHFGRESFLIELTPTGWTPIHLPSPPDARRRTTLDVLVDTDDVWALAGYITPQGAATLLYHGAAARRPPP